ncbi:MAG: long-chain fatty acid--CoA ligase [Dethiobacter sp.]|jgi:long-chain acyl-CoA synthetase|nr:long-chain fatty acid--CoA ligase [Dethiobacter sp.]
MTHPWLKNYEEGVPTEAEIPEIALYEILDRSAAKYPQNIAVSFMGAGITYPRLAELANSFAAALAGMGVKKGDRVAIHLPNCPQFLIAYFGTLKLGAIIVPCNPLYVEREMVSQLNNSGAEVIITLSRFYPLIAKIRTNTKLRHIIVTNIKEFFPGKLKVLFTLFKEKKDGHRVEVSKDGATHLLPDLLKKYSGGKAPAVTIDPAEDLAVFMYTGGTTGVPKGAMLTHRNLLGNACQTKTWFTQMREGKEVILTVLPLFHSYAMTTCLNLGIMTGATLILLPQFILKDVLDTIQSQKPTLFPGVPTMYVAINNYPEINKYDLTSISACISGAAGLPLEVQIKFEELSGGKLVEGYGLSEASPVTHANPIAGKRKPGSIGLPFPSTLAKVVSLEDESDLPVGEVGELAVKGPQVMKGYWQNDEETAQMLRGEWLFTGDMAKMDEDGYFYIVDRKKDMIIAGGYNIYPREVEEVLYTHPKVQEVVVASVPDAHRGETVKAYCVLKEGEEATPEEIIEFCKDKMAKYKLPTQVEFRTVLPKSMIGKILRRVLVEEERNKAKQ